MDAVRAYLLSVTGAAIVSAVILRLLPGKGAVSKIGKMMTALFMALTVISPITKVQLPDVHDIWPNLSEEAEAAVLEGERDAKKALSEGISQRVEAYILDKAAQLGVRLSVQVELSEDVIPVPLYVRLQGNVSPYAKTQLRSIIKNDLGLDEEKQIWT